MEKGFNIHILDEEKIRQFEEKYEVKIFEDKIVFTSKKRKGMFAYELGEKFSVCLNKSNIVLTRLTIIPKAVEIWKTFKYSPSLFRIQNAVNKLIVMRQDVNFENVKKVLQNEAYNKRTN